MSAPRMAEWRQMTRFGDQVQGTCPACGYKSLFLGSGGYVTCSILECPDPGAPSVALGVTFPDCDRRERLRRTKCD